MSLAKPFLLSLGLLASGTNTSPASFWQSFQTDKLTEDNNSQTDSGGYRAMYWQAPGPAAFSAAAVLAFAKKNSWQLVGQSAFSAQQLKAWTSKGEPIFPLTPHGLVESGQVDVHTLYQPRWIQDDLTVYRFKTGAAATDPKTHRRNDVNGFIVFNKAHTQLCVYHIWGDCGGDLSH